MKKVAIIMGSDSDLPIVQKAIDTLASFNVPYEVHVYSAHRTPLECAQFTKSYVAGSVPNCKYTNIRKAVYAGMIIFQTEFIWKKSRKRCSMRKEFYVQKIFEEPHIKYSYLGDTQRTLIWALRYL